MNRRRACTRMLAGLGGGLAIATAAGRASRRDARPTESLWRLSLEAIGAVYLGEPTSDVTEANLTVPAWRAALHRLGVPENTARALVASGGGRSFAKQIRDDFDRGRTADVGGWVLSVTEVAAGIVAWAERYG